MCGHKPCGEYPYPDHCTWSEAHKIRCRAEMVVGLGLEKGREWMDDYRKRFGDSEYKKLRDEANRQWQLTQNLTR